jgi:hypothetical protein
MIRKLRNLCRSLYRTVWEMLCGILPRQPKIISFSKAFFFSFTKMLSFHQKKKKKKKKKSKYYFWLKAFL